MTNKDLLTSNKKAIPHKKSRKGFYLGLTVVLAIIALIIFVGFSIAGALQEAKVGLKNERGTSTTGNATIDTDEIKKANVDATVNVDPNSPIAKEARLREEQQRKKAINEGQSYMPRVRVKNGKSSPSEEVESKGVRTVEVDELGQEKTEPNFDEDTVSDSDGDTSGTSDVDKKAKKSDTKTASFNPLPDIKIKTPFDTDDDYIGGDEKELIDREIAIKALELEQKEKSLKDAKRLANAKSLYSGLAYVPPVEGLLKVSTPQLITDPYATTSSIDFTVGLPDTSVSLLVRNDGGKTRTTPHFAYLKRQEEQMAFNNKNAPNQDGGPEETEERLRLVKGGESYIAQLTLPIDSDKPGPLRAMIKEGPFKGDTAMGEFVLIDNSEGIALKITNIFHGEEVYSVDTYALHPTTELPAFDDDVDHHYIARFGGLSAGLFISGFLESLVDVTVVNGSGGTTTEKSAITGTSDRIIYSMAKASEGFLPIFYDLASRPIQVRVPKGQVFKVLFTDNVYEQITDSEQTQPQKTEPESSSQPIVRPSTNPNRPPPTSPLVPADSDTITLWK